MVVKDNLLESAALARVVQEQLLVAVVFVGQDSDGSLDRVRALGALRRRMLALRRPKAASARGRDRTARTRL
ncbi:MAG: hypothetical protein JW889_02925 [Verrucomicrobia bacterium]|nr:hypothetical protein [Verrucomicrobiota bacterium]